MEEKKSMTIFNSRFKYNLYELFKIEKLIKLIISLLIPKSKLKEFSYKVKKRRTRLSDFIKHELVQPIKC